MEYKIFYRNKFIPNKSISVPYFDLYKEQEETANVFQNNVYTEEQKKNIMNYLKNKFFLNNKVVLQCPNKNKCFNYSEHNEFEYNLCKDTNSMNTFSFFEIISIFLVFILSINILFLLNDPNQ